MSRRADTLVWKRYLPLYVAVAGIVMIDAISMVLASGSGASFGNRAHSATTPGALADHAGLPFHYEGEENEGTDNPAGGRRARVLGAPTKGASAGLPLRTTRAPHGASDLSAPSSPTAHESPPPVPADPAPGRVEGLPSRMVSQSLSTLPSSPTHAEPVTPEPTVTAPEPSPPTVAPPAPEVESPVPPQAGDQPAAGPAEQPPAQ